MLTFRYGNGIKYSPAAFKQFFDGLSCNSNVPPVRHIGGGKYLSGSRKESEKYFFLPRSLSHFIWRLLLHPLQNKSEAKTRTKRGRFQYKETLYLADNFEIRNSIFEIRYSFLKMLQCDNASIVRMNHDMTAQRLSWSHSLSRHIMIHSYYWSIVAL